MLLVLLESGEYQMPTTNNAESLSVEDIYKNKNVLAFVIDNQVVEIFMCDERFSAILQSNPTIIDVTEKDPLFNGPHAGWKYDGQKFYID